MHVVVNAYGSKVYVYQKRLAVRSPDKRKTYAPAKLRSITLHRGTTISADAALLCIENGIDVLFFSKAHKPDGRIWSSKYGSVSTIRRKQLEFGKTRLAVHWVKDCLSEKVLNQAAVLQVLDPAPIGEAKMKEAVAYLKTGAEKIGKVEEEEGLVAVADKLRGLEGSLSRHYFQTIGQLVPEAFRFQQRSRRPAQDMFNALLNYSYGILYARLEGALIRAGLDPYVGVFHRDEHNRPSLVFDVIERFRHWAEYVCIHLVMQQPFGEESFEINPEDGGYWVESYAKKMLAMGFQDYFDEVIRWEGKNRSRENHLYDYGHRLATMIKNFANEDYNLSKAQENPPEPPPEEGNLPF